MLDIILCKNAAHKYLRSIPTILIATIVLFIAPVAYADCSGPNSPEGGWKYFPADKTFKFCDGSEWLPIYSKWKHSGSDIYYASGNVGSPLYCDENLANCFDAADVGNNVAGNDREIQFNSNGTLASDANFTFTSTGRLEIVAPGNSVFVGSGAGANDDGTNNFNAAFGYQALYSNTTGQSNSASGYQALRSNTTGSYNTASGYFALYSNSTGGYNTASGVQALLLNTTGNYNAASGYQALRNNTTGAYNAASGHQALYSNTTGNYNAASGYQALYSNTEANQNTAFGDRALLRFSTTNTGNTYNTAVGAEALTGVSGQTTGERNTALGALAGDSITTGNDNILIGYDADLQFASQSEFVNVGNLLYGDIGTTSGDPKIGTAKYCDENLGNCFLATDVGGPPSPAGNDREIQFNSNGTLATDSTFKYTTNGRLEIVSPGNSVFVGAGAGANDDGTNNFNAAFGYQALYVNTSGTGNTASGYLALQNNTTGTANTASGYQTLFSNTEADWNTAFGSQALRYFATTNTGSTYNTAVGASALYGVSGQTTGERNTALGALAGDSITTGNDNILIGYDADLQFASQSEYVNIGNLLYGDIGAISGDPKIGTAKYCDDNLSNCFLATDVGGSPTPAGNDREIQFNSNGTLASNTTFKYTADGRLEIESPGSSVFVGISTGINDDGSNNYNTGIGHQVLFSNTTGYQNTASGLQSLRSNTTGFNNTANGTWALYQNVDGDHNTASGYRALLNNTSGTHNTALGALAGDSITSGNDNILIGYDVDVQFASQNNHLNIGNTIYGDLSADKVGIGTATPQASFDVAGEIRFSSSGLGCTAAQEGAVRYTGGSPPFEYCDGAAWVNFKQPRCQEDDTGECYLQTDRSADDVDFISANIASGVNILGVTGSLSAGGCTAPASCPNVGDVCSDGSLFAGFIVYNNSSCEPLFVADTDQSTGTTWDPSNDWILSPSDFYDGQVNQTDMINEFGDLTGYPAHKLCYDLDQHGHQDWYLPALEELNLISRNVSAINANLSDVVETFVYYWSSTHEQSTVTAWLINFGGPTNGTQQKNENFPYVRCVRRD